MRNRERLTRWLIAGPPWLYLLLLFVAPTLIMVAASFGWPGVEGGLAPLWYRDAQGLHFDLTLDNYINLAATSLYGWLFLKSLVYAVVVTLCCLILAYPLALTIARSPKRWRDALLLLVILPFWSNFLVRIYAWMIILGPQAGLSRLVNGALGWLHMAPVALLFSPFAVLIGLVYVHLPFMILPLYANLEKHDPALLDAARDLGARPWQCFWQITFPLSRPGVIAGAILVFIPALGAFAVPDILGGTRGIMIGNVIKMQFLEARDWPFGSALSIVMTLLVLALTAAAAWAARRAGGRIYA
ncbi:MAG TPA: ABC transporter permease [Sulfuriferula sp.]|nr:ABC transporter permease [Sulfuriferula sp.]